MSAAATYLARLAVGAALSLGLLVTRPSAVHAHEEVPSELKGIEIEPHNGRVLPKDFELTDGAGGRVSAKDLFDGRRPVVLALAYYQCPMLCSLVLDGIVDGLRKLQWSAGKEYRFVVVSFDPRDKPENARAFESKTLARYGRAVEGATSGGGRGWQFLVGTEPNVRRLADAVGFRYRWDEGTKQFAHAAGAFIVTPTGQISRTLFGVSFPDKDLKLALTEASQGRLGGVVGRVLLFCFHYDPSARGYVIATQRVMRAFGVLTMLILGTALLRFWRTERRRAIRNATLEAVL